MTRMPTSYLIEKTIQLADTGPYITDPFVDSWSPWVSEIRHLAQSIIDEIDQWRNQ